MIDRSSVRMDEFAGTRVSIDLRSEGSPTPRRPGSADLLHTFPQPPPVDPPLPPLPDCPPHPGSGSQPPTAFIHVNKGAGFQPVAVTPLGGGVGTIPPVPGALTMSKPSVEKFDLSPYLEVSVNVLFAFLTSVL